ncbi:MAG: peptidase E [Candidatus Marinimicrobia bacterium]|jgi:dipeptidase E|nr:peptidase E [Candidatus Neomarinimicrobiota bacterium]MBT5224720.1 peptidase E [Candidatus Neomarinimicrobiota bacterium]MBT5722133.1 peptidase E [Candidatus Neomarinimicrobiota bacterium]MBT6516682.1 peptidase E [Candidatus Neomarinimicrobiota bacterium]MBT6982205.1 peptidase E [Candidatus Neomarinimicrobiota bacterium]
MSEKGHIIAIGGGGFGRNPNHRKIEKYILELTGKEKPNVVFFPTASAENQDYIIKFYKCFTKMNCEPSHVTFFQRTPRLDNIINKADVIYVGGGNTKSMLAVWQEWKLDKLLLKAYNKGKILCGVSAGAICWFEQGITDSWASNLNVMDCLGFLPEMACPHYQEEKDRKPDVHKMLKQGKCGPGWAIDGGAAIHFKNGKYYKSIQFYSDSYVHYVSIKNGVVNEDKKEMYLI